MSKKKNRLKGDQLALVVEEVKVADRVDSPWFVGPIGWKLADVVAIAPVPCSGQQGLWMVPVDLLPYVRRAYQQALTNVSRPAP